MFVLLPIHALFINIDTLHHSLLSDRKIFDRLGLELA